MSGRIFDVRIRRAGTSALLLELSGSGSVEAGSVEAWRAELWRRRSAGEFTAADIVTGANTILVDGVADVTSLAAALLAWSPPPAPRPVDGELVSVPIRYDGPDLDAVARSWRMSVDDAIARHLDTEFRVAFCGFAPGFGYLTGLPPQLAVPRLATPRTRVPAGSVGLADIYCGIYPSASPGGWSLIGRTDMTLFDVDRETPAVLVPGIRVRFVRAEP